MAPDVTCPPRPSRLAWRRRRLVAARGHPCSRLRSFFGRWQRRAACQLLLASRADPTFQAEVGPPRGYTALDYAEDMGQATCAKLLRKAESSSRFAAPNRSPIDSAEFTFSLTIVENEGEEQAPPKRRQVIPYVVRGQGGDGVPQVLSASAATHAAWTSHSPFLD